MNTEETPLTDLQTNTEDDMVICGHAETERTSSQMASDVNENKLSEENDQSLSRNEQVSVQSRDAQDSINNNENCNLMCGQLSCKKSCEDSDRTLVDSLPPAPLSTRDNASSKGKRGTGRCSNRNKKNHNGKVTDDRKCSAASHELATPGSMVSLEHRTQKQLRDSLFSLIQEGFEQTDNVRMLPTCLHQIAETYFQEEDYENAMQFIQLERIYHEQLLANLSAIQEQWETKWKTTKSMPLHSTQNSEKGLSSRELERLSSICGSHQDPQISTLKVPSLEKSMKMPNLTRAMGLCGTDAHCALGESSDRESEAGSRTTTDEKTGVAAMTENSPPDVSAADKLTRAADHQTVPRKDHAEEQQLTSSGTTSETPTQSTGTGGWANPDSSFSSGDAGKNNNLLQPKATLHSNDVSKIDAFSKEEQASNQMVDTLISAAAVNSDCASGAHNDLTGGRSSLECSSLIQSVLRVDSTEDYTAEGDGEAVKKRIINAESQVGETGQSIEDSANQKCSEDTQSKARRQATVEFIASLLNGDLKDSESFLAHLDFQEETFSEEEMSPSPGESILGDNFLSLDELAKRIEIEEVNPASGLVSILKKRDGSEGENLGQSSQKQTKRKVRFQETEDALDQEEIGGGSCILLIALCIVTVFVSIGGTALYCTFGDMESSICKDFAANMDFYYTQAAQGMQALRHWLFVT
ncbi:consortin [Mixophyes fleayi]|uniref:consortin n=1 Tax=Mixophyes fleayi TaxID=3061075 RepID=UPI003F4E1B6E